MAPPPDEAQELLALVVGKRLRWGSGLRFSGFGLSV